MKDTGVYLSEGDVYSLFGTGKIQTWPSSPKRGLIIPGWGTIARIGKNPIFHLRSHQWGGFTLIANTSGNLYLGIKEGELSVYGKALQPEKYRDNTGVLNVDIIVWKRENWVQIADFFGRMKRMDPTNKLIDDVLYIAKRERDYSIAALKTSKEIEETKKEIQELKKSGEPKKKESDKTIAKKESTTPATAIEVALSKDEKIAQLEAKLADLSETLNELAKLKGKWQKERRGADLLREKLSKVTEEKEVLAVKLESEADVRKQLETSLKDRETALKRKETLVESLYEKERQLKSKSLQLELAQGRSEEYKRQLEILNQRANQISKELKRAKSKEATAIAEDDLNKILTEKSNLQEEANNLKRKEAKLRREVSDLSAVAAKTRIEAERAKKELTAMRERETRLVGQIAELKNRLKKGMAPVLVITKPKHGIKIQSSTTMLHLTAVDDRGINKISVSLNGEPLNLSDARGIVLDIVGKVSIGKRFDIKERLLLQYGRNTIEVSVTDTDGISQKEIINVIREKERGDIWAVVIGINQYKNKRNLKYAVNDAKAFKNYLTEYIGVLEEKMFFLTDQNATRENIQSLL